MVVGALALAVAMTWPALRHPASTIPQDVYDPLLIAWTVAWGGHALATGRNPWDSNTFYPEPDSLAFSDSFLGYAPLALVGDGPAAALVRYNLLYVGVAALAFVGAYALARQLGARWSGALVAGASFGYAPWRLAQAGHLHVLSTGGIALALALLCRGHGYSLRRGHRPEGVRPGWAAAGWAVAAWQLTIGFGVGLPFAYVLGVVCVVAAVGAVVARRRGGQLLPRRLVLVDAGGAVAFGTVGLLMALPYLRVIERYPGERRTVGTLALYSPELSGFLTAPAESRPWGEAHAAARAALTAPAEMTLLPGLVVILLAVAGLALSTWTVRQRIVLAALVVLSVVLAMGTRFPGGGRFTFNVLFHHLPGLDGLRTPGRLVVWSTLGLGLLAAGAVSAVHEHLVRNDLEPARPAEPAVPGEQPGPGEPAGPRERRLPVWAAAVLVLPGLLVVAEGTDVTPHPQVPVAPAALRRAVGPVLVLPAGPLEDQRAMLWSTDGYPDLVNGGSGVTPDLTLEVRQRATAFPDAASVDFLRRLGVRSVVVVRAAAAGTEYAGAADAPVGGLPLVRQDDGDAVVFTLDPAR